ncbi:DUF6226 family protein [Streptomyces sp. Q6]|uniref:DUF6226 family protein n=1 Tax=Streptomyces citrinus TaxID=3118173 RepID=A0ACD5ALY8_9ACTN
MGDGAVRTRPRRPGAGRRRRGGPPVWRRPPEVEVADAIVLRPRRPDAVPLVIGYGAIDDVSRTVLVLGVGEPAVPLGIVPDCGCDACDDGSAGILEMVDESVLAVITGDVVHIDDGRGGELIDTQESRSASNWRGAGRSDEEVIAEARAGRSPFDVVRGEPWD